MEQVVVWVCVYIDIYIYICMMISAVNLLVFDRVWNEMARVE